jgi:uncharacterized protein
MLVPISFSATQAGDFGGGIERGVDDIITVLTTDSSGWEKRPQLRIVDQFTKLEALGWIALGLFMYIVILGIQFAFAGRVRNGGSDAGGSSGGYSGSSGSDGGFSGGGGDSGGGGASGSW